MFGEKKKAFNIHLPLNSFQQAEKGLHLLQKMKGVGVFQLQSNWIERRGNKQ